MRKNELIELLQSVKGNPEIMVWNEQVEGLLHWAKAYGYREPKNANGSKARCFFTMLQRYANKVN